LISIAWMAFCMMVSVGAQAQTYPNKPIRLIVPFPAGGATDIFARTLSQKLAEKLGTSVVVDNKPGAGGTLGSDMVAKASPDAYTLLLATSSTHSIGPNLNPKMPYDAVRDFTPIGQVGNAPSIMLVPNSSPAKTVQEWIDYARKNPGRLNYASSGNGTIVQLTAELFKAQAGLFVVHIPYKGTALAMPGIPCGGISTVALDVSSPPRSSKPPSCTSSQAIVTRTLEALLCIGTRGGISSRFTRDASTAKKAPRCCARNAAAVPWPSL
jgi:tripartite-type tricarboxylate transporter receptor subunit TctC